jgi:hydroxymethylbilane synthase
MNSVRIAARNSELAKIQAQLVGKALQQKHPELSVEYSFRESAGDQDLTTPLWQMGGRGVFTEDFYYDILQKKCDLVVHSWKDLPVEPRDKTNVIGVLEREDVRDVLLIPKALGEWWAKVSKIKILTSSPRRIHNLASALPKLLPQSKSGANVHIEFAAVRGNVPTRLRKVFESSEPCGVIIAKAALDRLIDHSPGFVEQVKMCSFMVLPLFINPPAPAQGCLAVEYLRENKNLESLLRTIESKDASHVVAERDFLASYGGGCHQKIGAYSVTKPYGRLFVGLGESDDKVAIRRIEISEQSFPPKVKNETNIYPSLPSDEAQFNREEVKLKEDKLVMLNAFDLLVSRENALPSNFKPSSKQIIWTSGVKTWMALAARGIWVHGTLDSLGEAEPINADRLAGRRLQFKKVTHQLAGSSRFSAIATYRLVKRSIQQDLTHKTHFYWMSGTAFLEAKSNNPKIGENGFHSCGPGQTYELLKSEINDPKRLSVFLNHSQWKEFVLLGQSKI